MRWAYAVTTWSGARLVETVHSVPPGSRLLVIDNSQLAWPLAKAWNYAIERICGREGFDAVICMNDDVVLRPDTGALLAQALLEGASHGAPFTDRQLLVVSARNAAPNGAFNDAVDLGHLNDAVPRLEPGPDFACFATSLDLLRRVGGFDEEFNPCYFEDNDMHQRIRLAGYEGGAYAPYWHFRSATIRTDPERRAVINSTFERNKERYIAKWGGVPHHERFTTPFNRG